MHTSEGHAPLDGFLFGTANDLILRVHSTLFALIPKQVRATVEVPFLKVVTVAVGLWGLTFYASPVGALLHHQPAEAEEVRYDWLIAVVTYGDYGGVLLLLLLSPQATHGLQNYVLPVQHHSLIPNTQGDVSHP